MKLNKIIYGALFAAVLAASVTSCRKKDFDINQNPNQPTDSTVTYNQILPAALAQTATIIATDWGWLQNWMSYWSRSGTYAPNQTEETYQITTGFGTFVWNDLYNNLNDYNVMQVKAENAGATVYAGIARIMKAHNYGILVDIYNNVPYKQALKGSNVPTPAYDNGADIYKDLLLQLDTAINLIKSGVLVSNLEILTTDLLFSPSNPKYIALAGSSNQDAAFANQKLLWVKFANTLKLRLLTHVADNPSGIDIAAELAKIQAEGSGYLGANQNAEIQPGYSDIRPSPFYGTYERNSAGNVTGNNIYYRANAYGIDYYSYNGDARRNRFYTPVGTSTYVGIVYGTLPNNDNVAANLSGINGPGVSNVSRQAWIMTSAESFLLQAELKQRGFNVSPATAQTLLTAGIRESFTYLGLTVANANAYISGNAGFPDVDITAAPLGAGTEYEPGGLFTILSQKYFALNTIAPYEVWTDYRRYTMPRSGIKHMVYGAAVDYLAGPAISVFPANTATEIPIRLLYPQSEYNYNGANVGSQGNINQFSSRIFWDPQ